MSIRESIVRACVFVELGAAIVAAFMGEIEIAQTALLFAILFVLMTSY